MPHTATLAALLVVCLAVVLAKPHAAAPSFTIGGNNFLRNGEPVQIRSGEFHYARIHPDYWLDRIERLMAMGLNTIQIYVPWNLHNPMPYVYNFEGIADLESFLALANKAGVMVAVRAGPYMCGEWEFGGFPSWLISMEPNITIRTYETGYISEVTRWWSVLLPKLEPFLWENGGPVIMMQVENEFGSFGNVSANPLDKMYIEHLVSLGRTYLGENIILYTTDGGWFGGILDAMRAGSLNGSQVLTLPDFGPGNPSIDYFNAAKQFNPPGMQIDMCTEYYTGWITHWNDSGMANTSSTEVANWLGYMMGNGGSSLGASFSLYMGAGGTNWGFWSGANGGCEQYQPVVTSYDYDSPVGEDGDQGYSSTGDKWQALLSVITKHTGGSFPPLPPPPAKWQYGPLQMTDGVELFKALNYLSPEPVADQWAPRNVEVYNQSYGWSVYSTVIKSRPGTASVMLNITQCRDRCQVFVDGGYAGVIYRPEPVCLTLYLNEDGDTPLDILVENMGRVNFGHMMWDPKGIISDVLIDGEPLTGNWTFRAIQPTESTIAGLPLMPLRPGVMPSTPCFFAASLNISSSVGVVDTFLSLDGWTKGMVWVNGVSLGRYWSVGPQGTLYVPAPILQIGNNEIVVLELDSAPADLMVTFLGEPVWNTNM